MNEEKICWTIGQKWCIVQLCAGGCEGRRVYRDLHSADEYCPFVRGEKMEIEYQLGTKKDLVHSNYLCTLIVSM